MTVAVPATTLVICWIIGWDTVKAYEVFIIASVSVLTFGWFGLYFSAAVEANDDHHIEAVRRGQTKVAQPRTQPGPELGFMLLSVLVAGVLFSIGWVLLQVTA